MEPWRTSQAKGALGQNWLGWKGFVGVVQGPTGETYQPGCFIWRPSCGNVLSRVKRPRRAPECLNSSSWRKPPVMQPHFSGPSHTHLNRHKCICRSCESMIAWATILKHGLFGHVFQWCCSFSLLSFVCYFSSCVCVSVGRAVYVCPSAGRAPQPCRCLLWAQYMHVNSRRTTERGVLWAPHFEGE